MPVLFRFIDQDGGKRGLVGSIRITLGLDSDTGTGIIRNLILSDICSVHKIAVIYLDRGLIGIYFQCSSGKIIRQASCKIQPVSFFRIQSIGKGEAFVLLYLRMFLNQ